MTTTVTTENQLIDQIYESALQPEQWPQLMETLSAYMETSHCTVVFRDTLNRARNYLHISPSIPVEIQQIYLNNIIDLDCSLGLMAFQDKAVEEQVILSEFLASSPQGINNLNDPRRVAFMDGDMQFRDILAINTLKSSFTFGMLTFPDVSKTGFTPSQRQRALFLAPHVSRAARIYHQLAAAEWKRDVLQNVINLSSQAVVLLDAEQRVIYSNPVAATLLQLSPALFVGYGGRLQAGDNQANQSLQSFLQQLQDKQAVARENTHAVRHAQLAQPYKLSAIALHNSPFSRLLNENDLPNNSCTCLFITDPARKWCLSDHYLQQCYEFTTAECDVARLLLDGNTTRDIASQRQTAEETVRWQLKCLYQKTATASQPELVRLLMALSDEFAVGVN